MSDRSKSRLDAIERRLTGAKRIGLFGHRAVGKTTLLAMFYREASQGRVPGVRLAAVDATTAEYLAEKIAQIESGEPPAGTLAETSLRLRLYHGPARLDLVVKDYQGEHVALGSEAPIREFFADCDAVLLCLDPDGSPGPVERRRRQQEIENLLERYLERSDDGTAGRPLGLLVTKYDRVLDRGGPPPEQVERLADAQYGMTRHALASHAKTNAIFAVSSYGPGVGGDGRPPAELHPMGLEGPLLWLAERLEQSDREELDWLWDLAPDDLPRLSRCLKSFERRYPKSDALIDYHRKLAKLKRRRLARRAVRLVAAVALVCAALAGYDALGYRTAVSFERGKNAPASVERRWNEFLVWHPSQPWFFPGEARVARRKSREWKLKADQVRLAAGIERPGLDQDIQQLKQEAPELTLSIRNVEAARLLQQHDRAWQALRVADSAAIDDPEGHLKAARAFLKDYPETTRRAEAVALVKSLEAVVAERRDHDDRQAVEALARSGRLPNAQLRDLIERGEQFLSDHPSSRYKGEVQDLVADFTHRLDEADIERARQFSREQPTNFAARRQRYQDYLRAHQAGGRFIAEANSSLDRIDAERDTYLYRLAYDHYVAHPDDIPAVAGRLRSYLDACPEGRRAAEARAFLSWWERTSVPNKYKVILRRGEVESDVGKYFAGGSPDLSVELWVGGVKYGPSPVVPNSHKPIWDYEFSRPIVWKYGDPITIRILDNDWSVSGVFTFHTPAGDKLAMKLLSDKIQPAKGGKTSLTFASDFKVPRLSRPE